MPKKLRMIPPATSKTPRKTMLLTAMRQASERRTFAGASPTSPRKTSAEPRGLISGSSTLKATRKTFQTGKRALPWCMLKPGRNIQDVNISYDRAVKDPATGPHGCCLFGWAEGEMTKVTATLPDSCIWKVDLGMEVAVALGLVWL